MATVADRSPSPVPRSGGSPWAPLRIRVFRAIWIASLVSNLGSWMHLVGAGWLMTSLTTSAALVAFLQSANALPSFLLALPGGAMADVFDRRRLILVTQGWQLLIAALLGVLTVTGTISPWLLLVMTRNLVTAAGDLRTAIRRADAAAAKTRLYQRLKIRLIYQPTANSVRVEANLDPDAVGIGSVSEGRVEP